MLTTTYAALPLAVSDGRLIISAIAGFAVIILLITWLKVNPFVALTIGSIAVGLATGLEPGKAVTSYTNGFGSTMGSVGVLIGLGAIFGKLLADSGGADQIVDTLVGRSNPRTLPWTMALVGAIIGLPMFFEIGLVLLIPVVVLVARRSGLPLMKIAIPTLAGLSAMHGLVPPHPGPLTAVTALGANLGVTLGFGVLLAVPVVIISGPLFSTFAARWAPVGLPDLYGSEKDAAAGSGAQAGTRPRPSFGVALTAILLPVVLMLAKALADVITPGSKSLGKQLLDFVGNPPVALLLAVIAGVFLLGGSAKMTKDDLAHTLEAALPPIAGILLIVGAGGGFKQVLIDSGIGGVITTFVTGSGLPVLLLAWVVAALVRVATGSATVATVTAAGLLAPVAATLPPTHVALMVLAVGSGSLFLSHVNDAGFWLVKQYLGTTVGQTFKTWSLMECLLSVTGLLGVLLLSVIV
ncbi:MAG: GntP family permease [Janthinobacterium lividum]